MAHNERRYVVDTSLFIDALRTEDGKDALNAFHAAYAPFEYLSAIVEVRSVATENLDI